MTESPVLFKRKKPVARSSLARAAATEDAGDDDAGNAVIKRAPVAKIKREKAARLSFGADESNDSLISLDGTQKRALKRAEFRQSPAISLSEPSSSTPQTYSATYLSELRASTQSRPKSTPGVQPMDVEVIDARESAIPTSNAVAAAKMKRELARKAGDGPAGGDDDFISLEPEGGSRLVREDEDELGEGDDDLAEFTGSGERIPLSKRAGDLRKQQIRAGIIDAINDAAEDDEYDEESKEWEAAQARRGDTQHISENRTSTGVVPYKPAPSASQVSCPLTYAVPRARQPPSLAAARARLTSALSDLQLSHKEDAELLQGIAKQRVDIDREEAELRVEVSRMAQQQGWFDGFNSWLKDMLAFLDAKYPELERIETDNLSHQRERLAVTDRKRRAGDSDDLAAFTGMRVPIEEEEEADDPHSATRRARRATRVASDDGYTTHDELEPTQKADLGSAIAHLVDSLANLFADVQSDEFRDPDVGVRPRFAEWRARFPESYAASYAGLAMVNVWEFWVRTEMALWNPFGVPELPASPLSLDGYQWHQSLTSYAHIEGGEPTENDDLVSNVVGTVILARLLPFAKEAYDPYSSRATGRALSIVEEITYCLDRNTRKFEGLIMAFLANIVVAVRRAQTLIQPHLGGVVTPRHALDTDSFVARDRFAARQVKLVVEALKWRRYARMLPLADTQTPLEPFIANELVGKVLLPVLEAGAKPSFAAQVLAVFPQGSALSNQLAASLKSLLDA